MSTFSEKVKKMRLERNMTQGEVAKKVGITLQSVSFYENGTKRPRNKTMFKLAEALGVSYKYLTDDTCEDPYEDIDKDPYMGEIQGKYDNKAMRDVGELLDESKALFAGGRLSQDEKDAFFEAVMKAYITCKEAAREKYGKKWG